jgi:hypothetical protein
VQGGGDRKISRRTFHARRKRSPSCLPCLLRSPREQANYVFRVRAAQGPYTARLVSFRKRSISKPRRPNRICGVFVAAVKRRHEGPIIESFKLRQTIPANLYGPSC